MTIDHCWASALMTSLLEEDRQEAGVAEIHATACAWVEEASADDFITATPIFFATVAGAIEITGVGQSHLYLLHALILWSKRLSEVSGIDQIAYDKVINAFAQTTGESKEDTVQSLQGQQESSPHKEQLMALGEHLDRWWETKNAA